MKELKSEMIGTPVNATVWVAPEKELTGIRLYYDLSFYFLLYHFSVRRFDGTALTLASWRAISPAEDFKCYSEPSEKVVETTVGTVCCDANCLRGSAFYRPSVRL